MKILKSNALLLAIIAWGMQTYARDGFQVTCVNSSNKCDNNALYETRDENLFGKTFFSFRPQDSDSSRRILGWFNQDYTELLKPDMRSILTISPQYTRSFDSKGIAQWFFFNGCDSMTVGIPSDTQLFDIDGSQIGLSLGTTYDPVTDSVFLTSGNIGSVRAKPVVENFIIDLDYWYDLSNWHDHLWLRLELPVVYMKTNMNMRAEGHGNQAENYPTGLFTLDSTADDYGNIVCNSTPVPYNSIVCALEGNKGWGSVVPLESGKFSTQALHKWGAAGLHFDLGYDIWDTLPSYFAASLHVVFPTGSRPKGTYVFEPVIGANKSWQVGATIIARYIKEFRDSQLGFYFYGVGTHLFKSKQERVFPLRANGPGSQLLLLKQFNSIQTDLINAERDANIFCGKTKIGATFMFDGSLMLQYTKERFAADIGYNFWVRTKESRSNSVWFRKYSDTAYGVKGSEPMEANATAVMYAPVLCSADLYTSSTSTIALPGPTDPEIVTIQPDDVNYGAALAPTSMSHKIFWAAGFKSKRFIMLCGEVELGTNNRVINQWGIMLKFGKDF